MSLQLAFKRSHLLLGILLLIFSLSLLSVVFGSQEMSRPTAYADPQSVASNENFAYDGSEATSANISPSSNTNVTYSSFSQNGNHPGIDILSLDLIFSLEVTGISDDQWAIEYSNDTGKNWYELRALSSGNQVATNLTYVDVTGPSGDWNWSSIASALQVRLRYELSGGLDSGVSIQLFEIWANVTTDEEGPFINLELPLDGTNYSGLTLANFTFNASDLENGLTNCTLLINRLENETNTSPQEDTSTRLQTTLDDGVYNWSIRCFDDTGFPNENTSIERLLSIDNAPPQVTLLSPIDEATLSGEQIITFRYAFTDISSLQNCSLYLNGSLNATKEGDDVNWPSNTGEFVVDLANGFWEWNVTCFDIYGRSDSSSTFNLTQDVNTPPVADQILLPNPIVPLMGANVTVWCNATITDQQGAGTISTVEAFLHRSDWPYDAVDETSGHHTNTSCSETGINATTNQYDCRFELPYFAPSMNWTCTLRVVDDQEVEVLLTNTTLVEELFAFDMSPSAIAYGSVKAGNISTEQSVTITNLGNSELDLALDGYAQADGDGFALICDVGNSTITNERYDVSSGTAFDQMLQLTDNATQVDAFNLQPKNDTFSGTADIYWRVQLGVPQKGNCTGYVTFTGVPS